MFGYESFSISQNNERDNLLLIIDGESYQLDEVGSGLAQVIIVLTHALIKEPYFVFIDEPESNLHPSLQIDFLTILGSYVKHGVLFATHNIGLARSVSRQIYSLVLDKKGNSIVRKLESTPRLAELLGELSFSGYREMGFEEILLVEGRTEIKAMFQFLRLYNLDHQVVMLPLGGNDLINGKSEIELSELTRISDNISAIIDSEITDSDSEISDARKDFKRICDKIKIDCHILERAAFENYFSERAIQKVKGGKYQALGKYGKLKDAELGWDKNDNWKIARQMTIDEIKETDFGKFLQRIKTRVEN